MSKQQQLYVHSALCEDEDNELTIRMSYSADALPKFIIEEFCREATRTALGGTARIVSELHEKQQLVLSLDGNIPFMNEKLAEYPPDGELFVIRLPTRHPSLYVHCCIGVDEDSEVVLRYNFVPGVGVEAIISSFCSQLASERVDEEFSRRIQSLAKSSSLCVSLDGTTALGEAACIAKYPPGGDVFLIKRQLQQTEIAEKRVLRLHFKERGISEIKEITIPMDDGATPTVESLLCEFARRLQLDARKVLESFSLSRNKVTALEPSDVIREPPTPDMILYVIPKSSESQTAMQLLEQVESLISKRQYAAALKILRTVDEQLLESPAKLSLQDRIGSVLHLAKRYKEAAAIFEQGLSSDVTNIPRLVALGKSQHELKQFNKASSSFSKCLDIITKSKISASKDVLCELQIRLGAAEYCAGRTDSGIGLVQEAVSHDTTAKDLGLGWMAKFYVLKNYPVEALRVSMDLLLRHNKDKEFQSMFATTASSIPNCFMVLQEVLKDAPENEETAAAWAFLGLVVRDFGSFDLSELLYARSLRISPSNASFALNYGHTISYSGSNARALEWYKKFFQMNSAMSVGGCTCGTVAELMGTPDSWPKNFSESAKNMLQEASTRACVRIAANEDVILLPSTQGLTRDPLSQAPQLSSAQQCTYSAAELDVLAMFFAVVKCLFVIGCLDFIPALLQCINPLRSSQNLHLTAIRNEQAYFSSIALLMQFLDPCGFRPFDDVLYVCGDSHSLPLSWHVINVEGRNMLAVNAIVTGLKCWHLRDDASFYPKRSFETITNQIPDGAKVLFLFGEIDCREGFLVAVERAAYDSVEDGMSKTIDIYLRKLLQLKERKKFAKVYIHFPLPILEVTRSIVLKFHEILQKSLRRYENEFIAVNVPVLEGFPPRLKAGLDLDTTHINPRYIPLLEEEILRSRK